MNGFQSAQSFRGQFARALFCGVAVISLGVGAQAQTTPEDKDDVVITGRLPNQQSVTKSDVPVIETPQSISVITNQDLQDRAVDSVAEALRYAPGITSESGGTATRFDSFAARGFALDQYLDGLRPLSGNNSLPQPDTYLLDSIEVLRGPASVLFGQASPGGIVNLVSKRPTTETLREIEVQAGSYNQYQLGFDLSGALSPTVSARIAGMGRKSDAQVDFAKEERYALAPSFRWKPDANSSLTLYANYQNDPHVGYNSFIPAQGSVLSNINGLTIPTSLYTGDPGFDQVERRTVMVGDEFEHRFNDVFTVRQKLRFAAGKNDFRYIQSSFLDADERTLNRFTFVVADDAETWTSDNQLQAKFATGAIGHNILAGVDYQHLFVSEQTGGDFATAPSIDIFAPAYFVPIAIPAFDFETRTKQRQTGLYAQDQASLGKWRFLFGGRYDWASTKTDFIDGTAGFLGTQGQNDQAFTGRAGVVYLFDNGVAPYASYSESFQPQAGTDRLLNQFVPTTGTQYEVGVKYQAPGSNNLVMVSLYDLTQNNVLTPDPVDPLNFDIQVGAVRSRGIEVSGTHKVNDHIDVTAAYTHVDQEVTKSTPGGAILGTTPATNPANQATLWLDYHPTRGASGFGGAIGVRYTGETFGNNENTFKVPEVTLVDAALRYSFGDGAFGGLELGLNVNNLFDESYVAGCSSENFCNYGFNRTVVATVRKRF